jgi:Mg2+-importing ATPase
MAGFIEHFLKRKDHNFYESASLSELSQHLLKFSQQDSQSLLRLFSSSLEGLSEKEVERGLNRYGRNEVVQQKPPSWWQQLLRSFATTFNLILFFVASISFFTDVLFAPANERSWAKTLIIFIMILISGFLRFIEEFRSQKAIEKLEKMVQNQARVLRRTLKGETQEKEIAINEVIPGDIILLSAGDIVPADIRLLRSDGLFVTQSVLTGESMPAEKDWRKLKTKIENPLEIPNLCFMGTSVVTGTATGLVIATGKETVLGRLAKEISTERLPSSFDLGIAKISRLLLTFILIMAPCVFLINWLTKDDWFLALLFALAVMVGLIPEMLPLVVSVNLTKGAIRMAKKKVIVKRLNAIENFGAMNILCTDKTGTLTENRVVLVRYLNPRGEEDQRVLYFAYLNSAFQTGLKNLLDDAVLEQREKIATLSFGDFQKIDEIPFDFDRRRMSVVLERENQRLLVCKGSPEQVLEACQKLEVKEQKQELLSSKFKKQLKDLYVRLSEDGLRVLAVAYRDLPVEPRQEYTKEDEKDLVFVGYIGFLDPPKKTAKEALEFLSKYGISIRIITGDNEIITKRICEEVGFSTERIVLGSEIAKMSEEELERVARTTTVFAKTEPLEKARIVEALKKAGFVVGYLGDGVNDAAAMQKADVAISVDKSTDIARESADIILLEHDLRVLGDGVLEGRTIFGNIMKYIKMTTSSNFGNMFSVLAASAFLPFLPMLPVHILIQNLLYDISQLGIPWDSVDEDFLLKPRQWDPSGIGRFMLILGPLSSFFDVLTFLILWFVFQANSPLYQGLFQAGWFVEGLLSQTIIVHIIRTVKIPFIQSRAAPPLMLSTFGVILVGAIIPLSPIGHSLGMQSLPGAYFLWLLLILLSYMLLSQLIKGWYIKRFKSWLA